MNPSHTVIIKSIPEMDDLEQKTKNIYLNISKEPEMFSALATCKTLMHFLNHDTSETFIEHSKKMTKIASTLKDLVPLSEVESVTEIFIRFTTLKASEHNSIKEARKTSQKRGELFLTKVKNCKEKIARHSNAFITDGAIILVHSYSEAVLNTLLQAKSLNKRFTVYVTRCGSDGVKMCDLLKESDIKTILINESAIGFYMERIDVVLVGAESVCEDGGIINVIGTYPLALCAKAMNKPFYVLVESYKFIRLYPVCQNDIPDRLKYKGQLKETKEDLTPLVDYTPPTYIDLLLTDLGTLTTAAVSDVLIQLYL